MSARLGVRESQCLHLIAEGMSNPEIAIAMGVTVCTVRSCVRRVAVKLGAENRAHAVALAYRRGWLDLNRCAA